MPHTQTWVAPTSQAFLELGRGAFLDAGQFFVLAARMLSSDKNSGSSCMAFVQNNLGVALLLQSKIEEARAAFALSRSAWEATRFRISDTEVETPVSSSGHHFRLASHHGGAFGGAHKRGWISLLDAASEITRANGAIAAGQDRPPINTAVISRGLGGTSLAALLARDGERPSSCRDLTTAFAGFLAMARELLAGPRPCTFASAIECSASLTLLAHPSLKSLACNGSEPTSVPPSHHDRQEI